MAISVEPEAFYETLHQRWKIVRREWKRCRRKASEPRIHDLRVALRRLLFSAALLSEAFPDLIPPRHLLEAKRHLKKLSKLRDLQVMLQRLTEMAEKYSGISEIVSETSDQVERRVAKIERYLRNNDVNELLKLLPTVEQFQTRLQQTEKPITDVLLTQISLRYRDVVAKHTTLNAKYPETIHDLRIAFKKYRYQLEAVAEHIPLRSTTVLKRMQALQTMLGDIHDYDVLLDFLISHRKSKFGEKSRHYQRPVILLRKQWQSNIDRLFSKLPTMNAYSPNRLIAAKYWKVKS
ncbi:MAG: CHAD domain-containing protein [bacterium]|nr:CHAD domain-containing protein [bacterium]